MGKLVDLNKSVLTLCAVLLLAVILTVGEVGLVWMGRDIPAFYQNVLVLTIGGVLGMAQPTTTVAVVRGTEEKQ